MLYLFVYVMRLYCCFVCHVTWKQLKNFVPGNSSTKPDQTGGDGKGVKQSKMLITLYIVGWLII